MIFYQRTTIWTDKLVNGLPFTTTSGECFCSSRQQVVNVSAYNARVYKAMDGTNKWLMTEDETSYSEILLVAFLLVILFFSYEILRIPFARMQFYVYVRYHCRGMRLYVVRLTTWTVNAVWKNQELRLFVHRLSLLLLVVLFLDFFFHFDPLIYFVFLLYHPCRW